MWKARAIALCGLAACGGGTSSAPWQAVLSDQPTALLSAWANTPSDVYLVGGDAHDGNGPVALHYDGTTWNHLATGVTNTDLWWTFGFADGTVFASGSGGTILKYSGGAFTKMTTPGEGTSVIVFGMWGAASDDVWAVGGTAGGNGGGFVWHYDGTSWTANADVDPDTLSMNTVFKVSGRAATDEVWMVGTMGLTLHWNGTALDTSNVATDGSLLSVASMSDRFIAVGGDFDGILYENVDGSSAGWQSALPSGGPLLNGVAASGDTAFAVGHAGTVLSRSSSGWSVEDTGGVTAQNLHAAIIDPAGGKWAMGGNFDDSPTTNGVLIYQGTETIGGTIQ
jgi:hypothetical protein